jgi:hypothetical protein
MIARPPQEARCLDGGDHDFRVNPNVLLMSNPPRQEVVCIRDGCAARYTRPHPGYARQSDPEGWPRP